MTIIDTHQNHNIMGGGGSAAAMAKSVQDNLALRRKRNGLFDRDPGSGWAGTGEKSSLPKAPVQVREKFRAQLEREMRADRIVFAGTISLLLMAILTFLYFV